MNYPQLVIPFGLPPAEHARDLVQLLNAEPRSTGLAWLLARHTKAKKERFDDFSLSLPHEAELARLQHPLTDLMARLPAAIPAGTWFRINPVHLHIASNHLVLTDYRQLDLPDVEAQPLFQLAEQVFAAHQLQLIYVDPQQWLLNANDWHSLQTASADAACGHNIDIWSPQGDAARSWRRLQNEIQMEWFIHPVQEQRQQRGAKPVNGLWLSHGTTFGSAPETCAPVSTTVTSWLQQPGLMVLDQLSASALAGDWSSWLSALRELDQQWLGPACHALRNGQLAGLKIILSNSNHLLHLQCSPMSLRKFWRSPRFEALLP